MIYLDSSALVKLALSEPESAALTSYLSARPGQDLVSSTLHRAEVGLDLENAAVVFRALDDAPGDPAFERALRVADRDHLGDEAAAVGDVDRVTALDQVDVDAGVLAQLADADPLRRQVARGVVHGVARVPKIRVERLAPAPVALVWHARTVAH